MRSPIRGLRPPIAGSRSGCERPPAFTLIELLVVVAVIALLVSILLPSLQAARAQAVEVKCRAHLHGLAVAALSYASANRDWTPSHGPVDPTTGYIMQSAPSTLIWGDPLPNAPPSDSVKNSLGLLMPQYLSPGQWEAYYCPLAIQKGIVGRDNGEKFGRPGAQVVMNYFYRRTMNVARERVGAMICDSFYPTADPRHYPPGVYHGRLPRERLNFVATDGSGHNLVIPGNPKARLVAPRWYLEYIGYGTGSQAGQEAYDSSSGRVLDWRKEPNHDPSHPQYAKSLRFRTAPWPQFDMRYGGTTPDLVREWRLKGG